MRVPTDCRSLCTQLITTKRREKLATAEVPLLLEGVPEGRGSDTNNWPKAILEKQKKKNKYENH
jgi:hypothetical protein